MSLATRASLIEIGKLRWSGFDEGKLSPMAAGRDEDESDFEVRALKSTSLHVSRLLL